MWPPVNISGHAHQSTAKLRRTGSADWPKPLGQGRLADEAQAHGRDRRRLDYSARGTSEHQSEEVFGENGGWVTGICFVLIIGSLIVCTVGKACFACRVDAASSLVRVATR